MAAGIKASADGLYGTLQVNGADIVTFNDSGNVGIGGAPGAFRLHVQAADAQITLQDNNTNKGAGPSTYINLFGADARAGFIGYPGSNNLYIWNESNSAMLFATNSAERVRIDSAGQMSTTNGAGAVALAYDCRAWVNFNGTGTVAIRASGNVSSITDNGTGNYTLNFTNAMPDVNYSVSGCATGATISTMTVKILSATSGGAATLMSTTALQIGTGVSGTSTDATVATVAIFR